MIRAAILTPAPDYHEAHDWAYDSQAAALEGAGIEVVSRVWNEPSVEDGVDFVVPLVAWGYHQHQTQWHVLLDRLEANGVAVLNPVPLLRWNSDKAYLAELADAGISAVPTIMVAALHDKDLAHAREQFATPELVIKPPVSAGADGTFRLAIGDPLPDAVRGRRMLIQPFQRSIVTSGELSVMIFDGVASHAVMKRAKPGDFRVQPHLGGREELAEAPPSAIALAHAALARAPARAAYARVDMIMTDDGTWQIMELELIEPALWLDLAPGSARRFGKAIRTAVEEILAQR